MKFLKYLLLLLLVFVIGFVIYVFTQPNSYDVSRTKIIKAPVSAVFNNVNDFKNWEQWGPWIEMDTTMTFTYPEKTAGVGGSYSWMDKQGGGTMTTTALVPNKSIDQTISFGGMDPNKVTWKFNEVADGTEVTWGMKGDKMGFMFKAIAALNGGADKMIGNMYEKGLSNLNTVITENMKKEPAKKYSFGTPEIKELPKQKFIGYFHKTKIGHEEMMQAFQTSMPKIGMYAAKTLKAGEFVPGAIYTKWDEEKGETEFYIGAFLNKDLAATKEMKTIEIPAGKALKLSKFGAYGDGDMEAHISIAEYMKANKLMSNEQAYVWEQYVNDPQNVKPIEVQTDIYYSVK